MRPINNPQGNADQCGEEKSGIDPPHRFPDMDQDRAAEGVVVHPSEREVVHHHRDLIRARNQPRAGDRDRTIPYQH
jgi:hypothetical protein